jgi:glutamate formiminotransferase
MVPSRASALVECVPNFSEGRRPEVMAAIESAVVEVSEVVVLDRHADAVHNRMVLTLAGRVGPIAEAAFRAVRTAAALIDLGQHRGVHPRIGATDVLPFVPLASTPMALCVELAERVGRRIAAELDIPIYLYGEAARRPERRTLPSIRRGEYERLRQTVAEDPDRVPDFGPRRLGPAGATAVGARRFLIAYNVTLATDRLEVADAVARAIRASSGGLPAVQARAFPTALPEVMQVSVNLLDAEITPLHTVFARIVAEAERCQVEVIASELVGMVPTAVLADTVKHALRFARLDAHSVIEARLLESVLGGRGSGVGTRELGVRSQESGRS